MTSTLAARSLSLSASGRLLVRALDMDVAPGQVWCVLGPNGAGKSTLLRTLAGLRDADGGVVTLGGRTIAGYRPIELARLRGFLPQSIVDAFSLTVLEAVVAARHPRLPFWAWGDEDTGPARRALRTFELDDLAGRDVTTLSGGERQRVNIAALFTQEVDVMLLDEPLASLDLHHQVKTLHELMHTATDAGKSVVYTVHDINLAYQHATHAVLLDGRGGAIAGPKNDVITSEHLSAAFHHPIHGVTLDGELFFRAGRLNGKFPMIRRFMLLAALLAGTAHASVTVTDDAGRTVTLNAPAHRIVSLAPNITDALFAAGAGAYVVGTSRFSDYPDAAKRVPIVGDATMVDLERIVGLKPDVIVVWRSGTPAAQVEKLSRLGIPIFYSETTRLADVASATRRFGILAGTQDIADRNAAAFDAALGRLRDTYAGKARLKVFYQIWDRPLMTIGHAQIIDDALALCGGDNVFSDVAQAAPTVSREAVLARNPDVIVSGDAERHDALASWRQTGFLTAVKHDNVFTLDAPTLALPSPSILGSVERLCRALDTARSRAGH